MDGLSGLTPERIDGLVDDPGSWDAWFSNMSPAEQAKLEEILSDAPLVGPSKGPQTDAFNSEAFVTGYGGAAGSGKALSNCFPIKTPFGEVLHGDVKAGDVVSTRSGIDARVISTKRFDDHPCLRVHFSDGTHTDAAREHLWLAWRSHVGRKSHNHPDRDKCGRIFGEKSALLYETQEIMRLMDKGRRYRVPLCSPVPGNFNRYKIDPYALGAFLGDGNMPARSNCRLTSHIDDVEIMRHVAVAMEGFEFSTDPKRPHIVVGRLSTGSPDHARLRDMGMLGKRSWEKALPSSACYAPIKWRWALLQGLMDTDGAVEDKSPTYCTTSPHLRDGVANLARSLGCFVTITEKNPFYTHDGEKREGRKAYNLYIKSATPEKLFRLSRKRAQAAKIRHQSLGKEIVDIEDIGKQDATCIQVNHPSGLYLTNDYTVTHNSALSALLAVVEHQRTVIFRADAKQIRALVDDLVEFHGTDLGLNRGAGVFRMGDRKGHMVEYGGIGDPGSELFWRGRPHDLIVYEECTELQKEKVDFLKAWCRSAHLDEVPAGRCRVVMTFNPPGSTDSNDKETGRWVIDYFAPWLDPNFPDPAKPGEIRYHYVNADNESVWTRTDEPVEVPMLGGEIMRVIPESRTFIPGRVWDNPYLHDSSDPTRQSYMQTLLALEEPHRSRLLLGDFTSSMADPETQVLPTRWVEEAMERWDAAGRLRKNMSALGLDVARGGNAHTAIARRYGMWFDEMISIPGKDTPDGPSTAAQAILHVRDGAPICIDANAVGASPYDVLKDQGVNVVGIISQSGRLPKGFRRMETKLDFYNLRAALWWLMRKILDPQYRLYPALPVNASLKRQLCAPHFWYATGNRFQVEDKREVRKRVGRSTDDADAVIYTLMNFWDEAESNVISSRKRSTHVRDTDDSDKALDMDDFDALFTQGAGARRRRGTSWMVR